MSIIREEIDDMEGYIRYIISSGDYNKSDGWKQKTKSIAGNKSIFEYLTKEWVICKEEDTEDDPYLLSIYEGNIKAWCFLIISLTEIAFVLLRRCNENAHQSWKSLIDKYEVSYGKNRV